MSEMNVNAYFEPADNVFVELDASKTREPVKFGTKVRICAITVSHGNDDYVIVSLKRPEDTKPFWKNKFYKGLNGQVFIQPIPKLPLQEVEVVIEPKEGTNLTDNVIVNLSYI